MSLGKHLEGYTVDDDGKSLKDLRELYRIIKDVYISDSDPAMRCLSYYELIIDLVVKILRNNGIREYNKKVDKEPLEKFWFERKQNVIPGVYLYIRLEDGTYRIIYDGFVSSLHYVHKIDYGRYKDYDLVVYNELIKYIPKELSM